MSEWSYDWTARLLMSLGFRDLREVEEAIAPYDGHRLSMTRYGSRQGQISRFELMVQVALGEQWVDRHPWQEEEWLTRRRQDIDRFKSAGIETGTYTIEHPPTPLLNRMIG
jgi:putative GTP pyrophosphokinase